MKKTKLHEFHVGLGARMVDFAGWRMPVYYSGIVEEHRAVRDAAGLFDVSHMGEIALRGPGFLTFADSLMTNAVRKLEVGQAQYTVMCYEDGGIVDDLVLYRFPDHVMLVVNAANAEKDLGWILEHKPDDVDVEDLSEATTQIALQGPKADEILAGLTDVPLAELPFYRFTEGHVAGVPVLVSRTGYTGERGFELYTTADRTGAESLWAAITESGAPHGVTPVGLGARDTLRLEMGYCLYGNDITASTNPLEAGLGWITKLKKGPFIGRDALLRAKQEGICRRLYGMEAVGPAIPRPGYPIYSDGTELGVVTSGGFGPSIAKGIALAYLPMELVREGVELEIGVRGRRVQVRTTKPPFYRQGSLG